MLGIQERSTDLLRNLSRLTTLRTALGHGSPGGFLLVHTSFSLLSRSRVGKQQSGRCEDVRFRAA